MWHGHNRGPNRGFVVDDFLQVVVTVLMPESVRVTFLRVSQRCLASPLLSAAICSLQ